MKWYGSALGAGYRQHLEIYDPALVRDAFAI